MTKPYLYLFILTLLHAVSIMSAAPACAADRNFSRQEPARQWLYYYKGGQDDSFQSMMVFVEAHPDFPAMGGLRRLVEENMPASYPDDKTLSWFREHAPRTTRGMKLYVAALRQKEDEAAVRREIRDWWKKASLSRADQQDAYAAFHSMIDKDSDAERLRLLIYREEYTNARALALAMGPGYAALAETRISLKTGKGNADHFLKGVPASLRTDEGLMFDRVRYRRMRDDNEGAMALLAQAPAEDKMHDPDAWGRERAILVRRLFEEGKYEQAYRLSAAHHLKRGIGFAQNEWMAGWLALEYLHKPWEAFQHFERLYHHVGTPISRSRAAYWAGLASERLDYPDIARQWYEVGGKYKTSFYGQLANEKLGRDGAIAYSGIKGNDAMTGRDLAVAAIWLEEHGHRHEAAMFLSRLIDQAKTPEDYAGIAELAKRLSLPNMGIRAAQECEMKTGTILVSYAFPSIEKELGTIDFVEWALVHALVRQESRYDAQAVSAVGARGLMQLMPGTAQEVARKAGLTYRKDWLTSHPEKNVALGTRYLRQMLNRYDGNYAMALAAYNAGPARVDRWVNDIGDPRNPSMDLIDWIEKIPVSETRNYVQRVLENVEVYRQILKHNKGAPRGDIHLADRLP